MTTPLSFNGYYVRDDHRIYQSYNTAPSTFGPFFYMFLTTGLTIEGQAGVLSFYTPNSGMLTRTPFIYLTELPDVSQRIQLCPVYDFYNYGMYWQVTQFWGNGELGRTPMRYVWYYTFGGGGGNVNQPESITAASTTSTESDAQVVTASSSSLPTNPSELDLDHPTLPAGVCAKDIIRVRFDEQTGEWTCDNEEHRPIFETQIKPNLVVSKDQVPALPPNKKSEKEILKFKMKWLKKQEKKKKREEKKKEREEKKEDKEHEKEEKDEDSEDDDETPKKEEQTASTSTSVQDPATTTTTALMTTSASSQVVTTTDTANDPTSPMFNYYPDPSGFQMPDYYQENAGKQWQLYDVWYTGFKLQNTTAGDNRTATAAWEWDTHRGKYVIYFKFFDSTGNTLQAMLRGTSDDMFNVQLENGDTFAGGYNPYTGEP
ncbi:hypothetical protein C9374_011991 [Naegleria lovaniensis]|uniref:Uncharacterized protein n=1 Tax=Naegleria lovaniensis TaxID=51637 RepID=A0AA88GES1_NAELO|nr:uncharacterized protein C9374_011991 [Naegleria lovaniensis]KAG2373528.1 hypothetical protein C9374_011991 [Naegleria lovaniensis]